MRAISPSCQRYIQAIIDQHARAVWSRDSNHGLDKLTQRTWTQIFFTNLNKMAAGARGAFNGEQLLSERLVEGLAIGDQVEQRARRFQASRE